jgi:hypothetical protein
LLSKLHTRLTYANVVATLALFVALGGSSYAAITVTGKNVRNSSLTGADVKNNSLTGRDVKSIKSGDVSDGSLLGKDFKTGQIPAGPQGPKGDEGAAGATKVTVRSAAGPAATPGFFSSVEASCKPGEVATGGGPDRDAGLQGTVVQSVPSVPSSTSTTPTGWTVTMRNDGASGDAATTAYVVCAAP